MNRTHLLFAAAVLVQVLLVAAVPAQKIRARLSGRVILLQIEPVDPYSILSGYYLALNYEISRGERFRDWPKPPPKDGVQIWAVVEVSPEGVAKPVHFARGGAPPALQEGEVALRGTMRRGRIQYGIESFYVPETRRREIEEDFRRNVADARAEVVVDADGNAALRRLLIRDRSYSY